MRLRVSGGGFDLDWSVFRLIKLIHQLLAKYQLRSSMSVKDSTACYLQSTT
jgi:hypothetical protein